MEEVLKEVLKEVKGIKIDIEGIKNDVAGIKNDVAGINKDLTDVKNEITDIKKEQIKHTKELKVIKKGLAEVNTTVNKWIIQDIERLERRIEVLENRAV